MSNPTDMLKGCVHKTNGFGDIEVVSYESSSSVLVRFLSTGFEKTTTSHHIRTGKIKDPTMPFASGVGFIGSGKYSCSKNTKAHSAWISMLSRCYGKNKYPTYSDCTVCEEWHNFQNFAEWYEGNVPDRNERYDLDKDMKIIGNKVYSPDTCMLITHKVNSFMIDCSYSRGRSMIGTNLERDGKYSSYCRNPINSKKVHLGRFSNEADAHMAWRKCKSNFASLLIESKINKDSVCALVNYKKALDNFEIYKDGFNYV